MAWCGPSFNVRLMSRYGFPNSPQIRPGSNSDGGVSSITASPRWGRGRPSGRPSSWTTLYVSGAGSFEDGDESIFHPLSRAALTIELVGSLGVDEWRCLVIFPPGSWGQVLVDLPSSLEVCQGLQITASPQRAQQRPAASISTARSKPASSTTTARSEHHNGPSSKSGPRANPPVHQPDRVASHAPAALSRYGQIGLVDHISLA